MNKVLLIGNLGADVELKSTSDGKKVTTLRLATNESYKDKSGKKVERVQWHRVVVWGKNAENCAKYLKKGRAVHIEGKLQTRSWEKDNQKHYTTEIVATSVIFLAAKQSTQANTPVESPEVEAVPTL